MNYKPAVSSDHPPRSPVNVLIRPQLSQRQDGQRLGESGHECEVLTSDSCDKAREFESINSNRLRSGKHYQYKPEDHLRQNVKQDVTDKYTDNDEERVMLQRRIE